MNYLVTVAPRSGQIREDMNRELVTLIRRDRGSFGHESNVMVEHVKEVFLNCKHFEDVTLILTADQVVMIYKDFKKTVITSIREATPCVNIDLAHYSKF
jgi:cellobiose-specific phosphotransferase system component IIB